MTIAQLKTAAERTARHITSHIAMIKNLILIGGLHADNGEVEALDAIIDVIKSYLSYLHKLGNTLFLLITEIDDAELAEKIEDDKKILNALAVQARRDLDKLKLERELAERDLEFLIPIPKTKPKNGM